MEPLSVHRSLHARARVNNGWRSIVLAALIILLAPAPVITTADLFIEFAIPPLYRLMAMDLLQLTVLALNPAKERSAPAIFRLWPR